MTAPRPSHLVARLSAIVGGTRLNVPGNLDDAARLKNLLGEELAILVVLHFGLGRFYVPLLRKDRKPLGRRRLARLRLLHEEGWSSARIARELKCSERTVDTKRALLRSRARLGSND